MVCGITQHAASKVKWQPTGRQTVSLRVTLQPTGYSEKKKQCTKKQEICVLPVHEKVLQNIFNEFASGHFPYPS